jgi:hypothetical protein
MAHRWVAINEQPICLPSPPILTCIRKPLALRGLITGILQIKLNVALCPVCHILAFIFSENLGDIGP